MEAMPRVGDELWFDFPDGHRLHCEVRDVVWIFSDDGQTTKPDEVQVSAFTTALN